MLDGHEEVLSVASSEAVKKNKESVTVARKYCGRLGKVENCQSGVYLTYVSTKGYALIDIGEAVCAENIGLVTNLSIWFTVYILLY